MLRFKSAKALPIAAAFLASISCDRLAEQQADVSVNAQAQTETPTALLVAEGLPSDQQIQSRLEQLGYQVRVQNGTSALAADAERASFVFISESVLSTTVGDRLRGLKIPVIVAEPALFDDMKMVASDADAGGWQSSYGDSPNQTEIDVGSDTGLIPPGFAGRSTIATSGSKLVWGRPEASARVIATISGAPEKAALFVYAEGTEMSGEAAAGRRIGFFLGRDSAGVLNDFGWGLFEATIRLAVRPELSIKKRALLVAENIPSDLALKVRLSSLGFEVSTRPGSAVTANDAVGKDVIYVSESTKSSDLSAKLRDVPVPMVVSEPSVLDDMAMVRPDGEGGGWQRSYGDKLGQQNIQVIREANPLTGGLTGAPLTSSTAEKYVWATPGPSAVVGAHLIGDPAKAAVFGYTQGAPMFGMTAPARRVAFFLGGESALTLTSTGEALFDAAIRWAQSAGDPLLIVVGNIPVSASDQAIVDQVMRLGFEPVLKTGSDVTTTDAGAKAAVIVSETVTASTVGAKFRNVSAPVLVMEPGIFDDMNLAEGSWQVAVGDVTGQASIDIIDPSNPLAGTLVGTVPVTSRNDKFVWAKAPASANVVASIHGAPDKAAIFSVDPGSLLLDGTPAAGRRLGFFLGGAAGEVLTRQGARLLEEAIVWTTNTPAAAVQPFVSCAKSRGGGGYSALFGYVNPHDASVRIPVGAQNAVLSGGIEGGQPTRFVAGAHVPAAFWVESDGEPVSWVLSGKVAAATFASTETSPCPTPEPGQVSVSFAQTRCDDLQQSCPIGDPGGGGDNGGGGDTGMNATPVGTKKGSAWGKSQTTQIRGSLPAPGIDPRRPGFSPSLVVPTLIVSQLLNKPTRLHDVTTAQPRQTGHPQAPSEADKPQPSSDPVNMFNGELFLEHEDVALPARGIPFRLVRIYRSRVDFNGPLGPGWDHSLNQTLVCGPLSPVCSYSDGTGRTLIFVRDENTGVYQAPKGTRLRMDRTAAASRITDSTGVVRTFDTASSTMTSLKDANGQGLDLVWELDPIMKPARRRVASVQDAEGRQFLFEYCGTSTLCKVSNLESQIASIYTYDGPALQTATDSQGVMQRYVYSSAPVDAAEPSFYPEQNLQLICDSACDDMATSCPAATRKSCTDSCNSQCDGVCKTCDDCGASCKEDCLDSPDSVDVSGECARSYRAEDTCLKGGKPPCTSATVSYCSRSCTKSADNNGAGWIQDCTSACEAEATSSCFDKLRNDIAAGCQKPCQKGCNDACARCSNFSTTCPADGGCSECRKKCPSCNVFDFDFVCADTCRKTCRAKFGAPSDAIKYGRSRDLAYNLTDIFDGAGTLVLHSEFGQSVLLPSYDAVTSQRTAVGELLTATYGFSANEESAIICPKIPEFTTVPFCLPGFTCKKMEVPSYGPAILRAGRALYPFATFGIDRGGQVRDVDKDFQFIVAGAIVHTTTPWREIKAPVFRQLVPTDFVYQLSNATYYPRLDAYAVKPPFYRTTVTDAHGSKWRYDFDKEGRMLESRNDSSGAVRRYNYDEDGNLAAVMEPTGERVCRAYDTDGNLVHEVRKPNGLDSNGVDEIARRYQYRKYGNGMFRLQSVTDPNSTQNSFRLPRLDWDDKGNLVRRMVGNPANPSESVVVAYEELDNAGRPAVMREAGDAITRYEYEHGVLSRVIQNASAAAGERVATSLKTDAAGRPETATGPYGETTHWVWKANRIDSVTTNNDGQTRTESFAYDGLGRIERSSDEERLVRFAYDDGSFVRKVSEFDLKKRDLPSIPRGAGTGDVTGVTLVGSTSGGQGFPKGPLIAADRVSCNLHAADGRLLKQVLPAGNRRILNYDFEGRETYSEAGSVLPDGTWDKDCPTSAVEYPEVGIPSQLQYDATGRVTHVTDGRGKSIAYGYDGFGRRALTVAADGTEIHQGFDSSDNLVWTATYRAGAAPPHFVPPALSQAGLMAAEEYEYDAANRVRLRKTWHLLHDGSIDTSGHVVTTFEYDAAKRERKVCNGSLECTTERLDGAGRPTSIQVASGGTTTLKYSAGGKRIKKTTSAPTANGTITEEMQLTSWGAPKALIRSVPPTVPKPGQSGGGFGGLLDFFDLLPAQGDDSQIELPQGISDVQVFYDAWKRVTKRRDVGGLITENKFDFAGRLKETTTTYEVSAAPEVVTFGYTPNDKLDSRTSRIGEARPATTRFLYDGLDRQRSVVGPEGASETVDYYGASDLVRRRTDANAATFAYDYDETGRVTRIRAQKFLKSDDPLSDLIGEVSGGRDPPGGGSSTGLVGGPGKGPKPPGLGGGGTKDRLVTQRRSFFYSPLGYLEEVQNEPINNNNLITSNFETNSLGLTTKEWNNVVGQEGGVRHIWDSNARPIGSVVAGIGIERRFDSIGRLEDLIVRGSTAAHMEYAPLGGPRSRTFGNGVKTTHVYDGVGRLQGTKSEDFAGTSILKSRWEIPADGVPRLFGETRHSSRELASAFTVDRAGRVVTEDHGILGLDEFNLQLDKPRSIANSLTLKAAQSRPSTRTYELDARHNWASRTVAGSESLSTVPSINANDQYTTFASAPAKYSPAGQLLSLSAGEAYAYDLFGDLISARKNGVNKEYLYDGLGRLVRETDESSALAFTAYGWDGDKRSVSVRYDGLVDVILDGDGIDDHLVRITRTPFGFAGSEGGATLPPLLNRSLYYHQDRLGNVQMVTGHDGQPVEFYRYTAYGEQTIAAGDGVGARFASAIGNVWGFQGHTTDQQTGLVQMRARWYRPEWGRFISEDPIGFAGGTNVYAFVMSAPLKYTDPFGLRQEQASQADLGARIWANAAASGFNFASTNALINFYDKAFPNHSDVLNLGAVRATAATANWRAGNYGSALFHGTLGVVNSLGAPVFGNTPGETAVRSGGALVLGGVYSAFTRYAAGTVPVRPPGLGTSPPTSSPAPVDTGGATRGGTEVVQRAMSRAELAATQETGLLRGGRAGTHFASDAVNSSAGRAQQRLGLPVRPEVRATLEVPAGRFSAPTRVQRFETTGGGVLPGGGMERTATGNIPARVLRVDDL